MENEETEKFISEYIKAFEAHPGNLEYPLMGRMLTPLCKICIHSDFFYGTPKEPICKVNFKDFEKILDCKLYECPMLAVDKESRFLKMFDENYKPKDF